YESGGEVLDLEPYLGCAPPVRGGHSRGLLPPQVVVRARADRDDLRLPEQEQGIVQHVHAQVDQRTATGLLGICEPAAELRDPVASQPRCLSEVGGAELTCTQLL